MRPTRFSTSRRLALALTAVFLGVAPLAGCAGEEPVVEEEDEALILSTADVAEVDRGPLASGITLTGTLNPYREVTLNAQVPGTVGRLRFEEGDRVQRGATMAVIEAQGIRSQAAGAQAGVAAAEAQLAQARRQFASAELLYNEGALAELDYEGARTQLEAAQAQVEAARAQAATAGEQAARTTISAPLSGGVTERYVEEGEAVNPGQPIYTLVNTEVLELEGQVPVEQAAQIEVGQAVEFSLTAYPERTFRGEVARINPTADPATRQVGVYLRLPNPGGELVGGLFATGRVVAEEITDALLVPLPALREGDGTSYVLALEENRLVRRDVRVTARDAGAGVAAVEGPLAAGQEVLVAPAPGAVEGANVEFAAHAARQAGGLD